MHTSAAVEFLARFPPFDALAPDELADVAAAASERIYAEGESILVEDAEPAQHLFVVMDGWVELVHEREVVDVLGAGEAFGHPSLLTGMAPAFTVRAREAATCLLVPRDQALAVLGRASGAGFVATTLRERLTRTGHTVHALPELGTTRVEELISRPPVFCGPDTTIRHAARTMSEHDASAIVIRDGDRLYTLTDAILRERVVGGELSAENPVSRIVSDAVIVGPDMLAVDAVVEMLDRGVEHLVVVDARREVVGVVSAGDVVGLETRSPFALRHAVLRARDEDDLVAAAGNLRRLFVALLDAGLGPADIGRVLSLQVDAFVVRLVELAVGRHGPAPVAWAWLALGSGARREFTLGSDFEHALAYADTDEPDRVDAYFEAVARDVDAGLARCGFAHDPNEVLASNRLWRMSQGAWVETFERCLEAPDRSRLIRANVVFDFRHVAGGLQIVPPLVAVMRGAREHPDFVRQIARTVTDAKVPLGFRGQLPGGTLDIKRGGNLPIANLARFFALANGITISATLDRLAAATEVGALDTEVGAALHEAFGAIMRVRLEHQARCIAEDRPLDNLVRPDAMTPLARTQLREALRVVAHAQKRLNVYVPLGL